MPDLTRTTEENRALLERAAENAFSPVTKERLRTLISSAQECNENKTRLEKEFGGTRQLARLLGTDLLSGLSNEQVSKNRALYGSNEFPELPMKNLLQLFIAAFDDAILIVLIAASVVSLGIGAYEDSTHGWIEGAAILIAVLIVASVTAGNDYTKELQFRALEKSSEEAERSLVFRNSESKLIHPREIVVGDILLLKAGDSIPADGIIVDGEGVKSNESGLTGEPDDLSKNPDGSNPFLFSSCLITEVGNSSMARILVTGVGVFSEWGKIRETLTSEPSETPLQIKLDSMATMIGYIGVGFALATFIVLFIMIFTRDGGQQWVHGVVSAFIIGVTIVVVAIPEGLPLAVTISLAYSTRKMYMDQNLIRVLAACETMGNATNICSDKTGTLTLNQMTVLEGYFGDKYISEEKLNVPEQIPSPVLDLFIHNCIINRSCEVHFKNENGKPLHKPKVIGSATEGALVILCHKISETSINLKKTLFDPSSDREYPFNSSKKRSSVLLTSKHRGDRSIRLYCKGASEKILEDCTHYTDSNGLPQPFTPQKRKELDDMIFNMANNALRTICLAHRDFESEDSLPKGWETIPPDNCNLICDAIVGIMDPLRPEVKDAVSTAQKAGVMVRMVTGDNIHTAKSIARSCGILSDDGIAIEGPQFRNMSPKEVDEILPKLQVLARSTPNDKYLLVSRLNGQNIPRNESEWLDMHDKDGSRGLSWTRDRDKYLPGYIEEWHKANPTGGEVVGVTGDGTNDAPALKAADVGLSMGITGTKVAQNASDIVILDDRFSSIVRAIMWGRSVYDNIRKFLQFQLTVNVVALSIVLIGSIAGFDPPLNAVMMLWVNLIMDTMGALALGTEKPTLELLKRKPYSRRAPLISRPMMRNILVISLFQLCVLLGLLFRPRVLFSDIRLNNPCKEYSEKSNASGIYWDPDTKLETLTSTNAISCSSFFSSTDFSSKYPGCGARDNAACYDEYYSELNGFENACFDECVALDYVHYSIIFNAFVFSQIFNELNARSIGNKWNVLKGIHHNYMFISIIVVTLCMQIFVIESGGEFTKTASLTADQWLRTALLGLISLPLGVVMRFIPIEEDPTTFAGYDTRNVTVSTTVDNV